MGGAGNVTLPCLFLRDFLATVRTRLLGFLGFFFVPSYLPEASDVAFYVAGDSLVWCCLYVLVPSLLFSSRAGA